MRPEIEEAVHLLKTGDDRNLEEALSLLQSTIFSFSMRMCGQREDAEDTMQEVLLKSVPQLPKFDNPKALLVWLYKVARSRCLMNRRKSKFAPLHELSLEELMPDNHELENLHSDGQINPEAFAIRSEEAGRLRQAIQRLPPRYRIVLVLRDMEELTDEEVGEITGLRPGTVRVRLHRARLFVRKELMSAPRPRLAGTMPHAQSTTSSRQDRLRCKAMFAELSNYLDEQLDDAFCEELERHMDGCDPCEAFLASLQSTIEQCRKAPSESLTPAEAAKLRRQLTEKYQLATAALRVPV